MPPKSSIILNWPNLKDDQGTSVTPEPKKPSEQLHIQSCIIDQELMS